MLRKGALLFINMGRSPCYSEEGVNRRTWTATEDKILSQYIHINGEGGWKSLPKKAGLNRRGKSCRLRWLNYLRPDIKRGNISSDEDDLIIRMHRILGNRWALIAGRLPGRTDNEIKNYWNTQLSKRLPKPGNIHKIGSSSSPEDNQIVIKTSPVKITTAVRDSPTLEPNNGFYRKENRGSDCKCLKSLNEDHRPWTSPEIEQHWKISSFSEEKVLPSMDSMIERLDDCAHVTGMGGNWSSGECCTLISSSSDRLPDFGAQSVCMLPELEELYPFQVSYMEEEDNCLEMSEMDASNQLKSILQFLEFEDQGNEEEPLLLPTAKLCN